MTFKSSILVKLGAFASIMILTGLFVKCSKPPTEAKITIVNLYTGTPIDGATVLLQVDSAEESGFFTCDNGFVHEKEYRTNSSGVINECFELPALITVIATLETDSTLLIGTGKLNLVEHEKTNLTVKMN